MPNSKPIRFADDRSLIITNLSPIDFKKRYHHIICSTNTKSLGMVIEIHHLVKLI